MKNRIKKICFGIFCAGFVSLVIYSMLTAGNTSSGSPNVKGYGKTLSKVPDEPEIRADSLYFNMLDAKGQYVYDVLKDTISKGKQYTDLMPLVLTESELSDVVRALTYDDPSLYYVNVSRFDLKKHSYTDSGKKSGRLVILPSVVEDKYTRIWIPYTANDSDNSKFLEKANNRFKASLKKADEMVEDVHDVYLVCQLIHDYLCGVCKKVESGGVYADTAYGALVEGEATSLGYAKAFKLLYARYGGNSFIVNGGRFYWNTALINDNYYNIDIYGDDLDGVLNGTVLRGATSHLYLCRDDETFYLEHERSVNVVPVCSDKTTYYSHNGFDPSTPSEMYEAVMRQVDSQMHAKNYYFEISTELDSAPERIREAVLRALAENCPEYANGCEVYRQSEKLPVYIVRLVRTDTEGKNE
ncbi:MAG: hypothetical protein J5879_05850 [Clostridia bacterium]|nr:hypothetical protein [Clostridia bacterium]